MRAGYYKSALSGDSREAEGAGRYIGSMGGISGIRPFSRAIR